MRLVSVIVLVAALLTGKWKHAGDLFSQKLERSSGPWTETERNNTHTYTQSCRASLTPFNIYLVFSDAENLALPVAKEGQRDDKVCFDHASYKVLK